jgi:predicted metal-dependent hydrolase
MSVVGRRGGTITRERLRREIEGWATRIEVTPARVQIQPMRSKWASCSPAGRLTFSADLLAAPAAFRNEVIVHELLHLIVANHGKLFRSLLRAHLQRSTEVAVTGSWCRP